MNPKVSVILPVYNCERYISQAIDSILNQTFQDFELIIVNDGSQDKTRRIIDSYKDARIIVVENEFNEGAVPSRNKAIALAKGEYIALQDADDKSLPEKFSKQVKVLDENSSIGAVGSYFVFSDMAGKESYIAAMPCDNKTIQERLPLEFIFCHCSIMFRAKIIKALGGYRKELFLSEDYDLLLRVSEVSQIVNIPEVLYAYRLNHQSSSLTRRCEQRIVNDLVKELAGERRASGKDRLQLGRSREVLDFLKQESEKKRCKSKRVRSYAYFWWAFHLKQKKCFSYARNFLFRAICIFPFEASYWKLLALVLLKRESVKNNKTNE
ncbi:MAG: glycosyltransferase [Candidatus Omnitrophica bacterium]|nr:glycosyltransferase [Candidatus Omnitrophota bacterium]